MAKLTPDGGTTADITLFPTESTTFYFAAVTKARERCSCYSEEKTVPFVLALESDPLPPTGLTIDIAVTCTTNDADITCRFDLQSTGAAVM